MQPISKPPLGKIGASGRVLVDGVEWRVKSYEVSCEVMTEPLADCCTPLPRRCHDAGGRRQGSRRRSRGAATPGSPASARRCAPADAHAALEPVQGHRARQRGVHHVAGGADARMFHFRHRLDASLAVAVRCARPPGGDKGLRRGGAEQTKTRQRPGGDEAERTSEGAVRKSEDDSNGRGRPRGQPLLRCVGDRAIRT